MKRITTVFALAATLGIAACDDRPFVNDENDVPDRVGVSDEPDSLDGRQDRDIVLDRDVDINVDDDRDDVRVRRTGTGNLEREGEMNDGDGRTFPDRDMDGKTGTEEVFDGDGRVLEDKDADGRTGIPEINDGDKVE